MTAPELKPCPFCGGAADIWRAHEGRTAWIACMGKCVVLVSKEYLSDDEAIAAWNRRADLAQPAQVQPDPRDEVIKGLVEAATDAAEAIDMAYGSDDDESPHRHSAKLRAALAAAKAVQK